jgi:hypothetical protein
MVVLLAVALMILVMKETLLRWCWQWWKYRHNDIVVKMVLVVAKVDKV